MIAAGHALTFTDVAAHDVIAAGGGLDFSGQVADDMVAVVCPVCPFASRRLHLGPETVIGDEARLAGGDLDIEGTIGGDLYAAATRITLAGEVAGKAELLADRIVLAPGARVGGDLVYHSRSEPEIASDAVIVGETRRMEGDMFGPRPRPERPLSRVWSWIVMVLALVLFGAVLQLVVPGLLGAAVATLHEREWSSLGIGLVILVATPIAVASLFATIIGAPLAVFTVALWAVAGGLALATIAYWAGCRLWRLTGGSPEGAGGFQRVMWTAAGFLVLALVGAIPFVGGWVVFIAALFGLGALFRQAWNRLRAPPPVGATV